MWFMQESDLLALLVGAAFLIILGIAAIAVTAGNIVNKLLAPIPSVAGPLGAAVALFVFVYLIGKGAKMVLGQGH